MGTYDSDQLERHVELQDNAKTAQFQQALTVARLNKRRNEGPIDALRDEWWSFQDYVDAKREVKEHPDSVKCQEVLTTAERKINGLDRRVARDEAEAKKIEDKIFELNQPPARKYALIRIAPGTKPLPGSRD